MLGSKFFVQNIRANVETRGKGNENMKKKIFIYEKRARAVIYICQLTTDE